MGSSIFCFGGSGEGCPLIEVLGVDGVDEICFTIGIPTKTYMAILRDIHWEGGQLVQKQEVR